MKRREFLRTVGAFGVSAAIPEARPLESVRVGVIGLGAIPDFTRGRYKTREPLQVARASESVRFPESFPTRNHDKTNERKMPS